MVPSGRRSGKTELAKRKIVISLAEKKEHDDVRYFVSAPTRMQAKRIYWDDFKKLIPAKWIKKTYETDLVIKTIFNSELWVLGLDRPERIEGSPWDGAVLDEYADMKPGLWQENVRPALSDRLGWCWLIGVPNGLNHYKDIVDYARSGRDQDWGCYSWFSEDILPKEEMEAARRTLDPVTYRQEYQGSFESATGRVYYSFTKEKNIDSSITIKKELPIIVSCDFNVDPCVWVICQSDGFNVWVIDELVIRNTNTAEMCRSFLSIYNKHKKGVFVYGDSAGNNRSTTGKSDYLIMNELGLNKQFIKKKNPFVKDRVNAVNSMLENLSGQSRIYIHPKCNYLIKDLETVQWKSSSFEINKANPEKTHASDALGYFIEYEFPAGIAIKNKSKMRFYK